MKQFQILCNRLCFYSLKRGGFHINYLCYVIILFALQYLSSSAKGPCPLTGSGRTHFVNWYQSRCSLAS